MIKYTYSYIIIALFWAGQLLGQATTPFTNGVSTDYLGWNASVNAPLNLKVYNQNDFVFRTGNQFQPNTLSPKVFVLGTGNSAGFNERLNVRLDQMQGSTRIGIFADHIDPVGTFIEVKAGNFTVRGNGYKQRAVESMIYSSSGDNQFGIKAHLCGTKGYAIYAEAYVANTGFTSWAAWFDGSVYRTANWGPPSDSTLKQNVTLIENPLSLISNFEPKQYHFKVEEYETLHLPQGLRYGFIAQDVETFLPELVSIGSSVTKYDENDEVIHDPVEFRGVNYIAVIPIIVGALNERQTIIDEQISAIAELEETIAILESQFEE